MHEVVPEIEPYGGLAVSARSRRAGTVKGIQIMMETHIAVAGDYRIEDITMKENSAGYIYTRGMVRNLSNTPIKGYVVIDFLNANGDTVYSMRSYVNEGREIYPGKAAFFVNTIYKDSAPGVQNVQVEFRRK